MKLLNFVGVLLAVVFLSSPTASASGTTSQAITLEPGWNIVSTPKVLESYEFSVAETAENFDIYLLDPSQPSGWATMADLSQTEFTPLYGYFINNKTDTDQMLTFNYDTDLSPNEQLFERTFLTEGWYSIGVANDEYVKKVDDYYSADSDNPSKVLSLMDGNYDLVGDFTDAEYIADRNSVSLGLKKRFVNPEDVNELNDFRETKGYAMYVKESGAKYIGFQNNAYEEEKEPEVILTGEAVLSHLETDSASKDEIEEGSEYEVVMESVIEFTNGDAEIESIDVAFVGFGDELDPWDTFKTVSLWIDGDMVEEEDISEQEYYLDEDLGVVQFTNLGIIAFDDEEVEIIVAVNVENSVEGTYDGEEWTVAMNSMRFFKANDIATTVGIGDNPGFGTREYFEVIEGGSNDELIVKTSPNDPDSTTLQVEDYSDSDWYTVFVFDLDTDESVNDIQLNSVPVTVSLSSSTIENIVDDYELMIDGITIDDVISVTGETEDTAIITFDVNGDVVIDAGDRVEVELMLRFNSLEIVNEGVTVTGSVAGDAIDAEGFDDLSASQLAGTAIGDTHTLRTQGITVFPESTSVVVTTVDGADNDYAAFEIEVEVTAFEQDVYISTDPAASIAFTLEDGAGSGVDAGTRAVVLISSADETGAYFEINEGQTEIVTLKVTYAPSVATSVRLVLNSIAFAETASVPNQVQSILPATEYRTSVVTIID